MSIVFLLIPLGLVIAVIAAAALLWAVDNGQYDGDVESQGRSIIDDDSEKPEVEAGIAKPPGLERFQHYQARHSDRGTDRQIVPVQAAEMK